MGGVAISIGLERVGEDEEKRVVAKFVCEPRRRRVVGLGGMKKKDAAEQQNRELLGDALKGYGKCIKDPKTDHRQKEKDQFR